MHQGTCRCIGILPPLASLAFTVQGIKGDGLALAITNTGTAPATGLHVRLLPSSFTVKRAHAVAVGNLLPGEFAEATLEVDLPGRVDAPPADIVERAHTDDMGHRRRRAQQEEKVGEAQEPWERMLAPEEEGWKRP